MAGWRLGGQETARDEVWRLWVRRTEALGLFDLGNPCGLGSETVSGAHVRLDVDVRGSAAPSTRV